MARLYATVVNKGCAARFAFAAAIFGETSEALFWLQLPRALNHLTSKLKRSPQKAPNPASSSELEDTAMLSRITSKGKSTPGAEKRNSLVNEPFMNLSGNFLVQLLCLLSVGHHLPCFRH